MPTRANFPNANDKPWPIVWDSWHLAECYAKRRKRTIEPASVTRRQIYGVLHRARYYNIDDPRNVQCPECGAQVAWRIVRAAVATWTQPELPFPAL